MYSACLSIYHAVHFVFNKYSTCLSIHLRDNLQYVSLYLSFNLSVCTVCVYLSIVQYILCVIEHGCQKQPTSGLVRQYFFPEDFNSH